MINIITFKAIVLACNLVFVILLLTITINLIFIKKVIVLTRWYYPIILFFGGIVYFFYVFIDCHIVFKIIFAFQSLYFIAISIYSYILRKKKFKIIS